MKYLLKPRLQMLKIARISDLENHFNGEYILEKSSTVIKLSRLR